MGRAALERPTNFSDITSFFKDYKVFLGWLMYFGLIVPAYGYAYFSTTIIKTYGYSPIQSQSHIGKSNSRFANNVPAQLHSVPPWAAAWTLAMILSFVSDGTKHRISYALFAECLCIVGLAMLTTIHKNLHAEYAALFVSSWGGFLNTSFHIPANDNLHS